MDHQQPFVAADGSPLLLTAEQVAGLLQISPRTLWRLLSSKQVIPPVRLGGATRWRRDELQNWIDAGCPRLESSHNTSRR